MGHCCPRRRTSIAIAVVAIFVLLFQKLPKQSEVTTSFILPKGLDRDQAFLGKIECVQCDVGSIPNISPFDFENDPECSGHDDWFYRDKSNNKCSFCQYGTYDATTAAQSSSRSAARKILFDQNFANVFLIGSSTLRQMYLNLVGSFREDQNYTNRPHIEHYFHTSSWYSFNGTNDAFRVHERGKQDVVNTSHSINFIWDADLKLDKFIFTKHLQEAPVGGNTILIMGNHFWNRTFHKNIPKLVDAFFYHDGYFSNDMVLVWVHAWPLASWKEGCQSKNKEIAKLKLDSSEYIAKKRNDLLARHNGSQHQLKIIEIDVEKIMHQELGTNNLTNYYMKEDGMHLQCNHLKMWPDKITRCDQHKHHMGLDTCTDPVNDLIWNEIHKQLIWK